MRGREFIRVAVDLRTTSTEAADRTRIGRSYYAAFLETREFAQDYLGLAPNRTTATHGAVSTAIAAVKPELAVNLATLRKLRNDADYETTLVRSEVEAAADQCCFLAGLVILDLDGLAFSWQSRGRDLSSPSNDTEVSPRALERYLPQDLTQRDEAVLILLSYPHLVAMILRAIDLAARVYPAATPTLDTARYDDTEPPIWLLLHFPAGESFDFREFSAFQVRLMEEAGYDPDVLGIFARFDLPNDVPPGNVREVPDLHYRTTSQ